MSINRPSQFDPARFGIRHADSGDADPWAGRWTPSRRLIEIDPVQCRGRMERRRAVLHEIGHALGCAHVDVPTAVMFERLGDDSPEIGFDTYGGNVPTDFVTADDLAEYNRVRALASEAPHSP